MAKVQGDLRRRILRAFVGRGLIEKVDAKEMLAYPLLCPLCGGQMRLIAFITDNAEVRKILEHISVDSEPPHISPARGPPL